MFSTYWFLLPLNILLKYKCISGTVHDWDWNSLVSVISQSLYLWTLLHWVSRLQHRLLGYVSFQTVTFQLWASKAHFYFIIPNASHLSPRVIKIKSFSIAQNSNPLFPLRLRMNSLLWAHYRKKGRKGGRKWEREDRLHTSNI